MAKKLSWAEMDKSKIPFGKLHTAFELYNRTTNKSPRTVQWYNDKLILFERHLGSNAVLADLTLDNVRAFIAELQSRGVVHANSRFVKNKTGSLSSSYIQGFARALRAFASWLYEEGYTTTNVLKTLRPPRVQHKVIEVLTDKEVSALLGLFNRSDPLRRAQLRRHHHFAGLRPKGGRALQSPHRGFSPRAGLPQGAWQREQGATGTGWPVRSGCPHPLAGR